MSLSSPSKSVGGQKSPIAENVSACIQAVRALTHQSGRSSGIRAATVALSVPPQHPTTGAGDFSHRGMRTLVATPNRASPRAPFPSPCRHGAIQVNFECLNTGSPGRGASSSAVCDGPIPLAIRRESRHPNEAGPLLLAVGPPRAVSLNTETYFSSFSGCSGSRGARAHDFLSVCREAQEPSGVDGCLPSVRPDAEGCSTPCDPKTCGVFHGVPARAT